VFRPKQFIYRGSPMSDDYIFYYVCLIEFYTNAGGIHIFAHTKYTYD